jgi:hypothetical protein
MQNAKRKTSDRVDGAFGKRGSGMESIRNLIFHFAF